MKERVYAVLFLALSFTGCTAFGAWVVGLQDQLLNLVR